MSKNDAESQAAAELLGAETASGGNDVLDATLAATDVVDEDALRAEGIDPHHPLLSVQEQREAIGRAHAKVNSDAKAEAKKALEKSTYDRERGLTGLRTGDPTKDEQVFVTLDLAEHSDKIVLNGVTYWHGQTYKVPRHVADTMREIQQRGHNHQLDLDGKGIAERGKKMRLTAVKADAGGNLLGIQNAPAAA